MAKVTKIESYLNFYLSYVSNTDFDFSKCSDVEKFSYSFTYKGHRFELSFLDYYDCDNNFNYMQLLVSVDNGKRTYFFNKRAKINLRHRLLSDLHVCFDFVMDVPY